MPQWNPVSSEIALVLLAACVDPTAPASTSAGCPAGEILDGVDAHGDVPQFDPCRWASRRRRIAYLEVCQASTAAFLPRRSNANFWPVEFRRSDGSVNSRNELRALFDHLLDRVGNLGTLTGGLNV